MKKEKGERRWMDSAAKKYFFMEGHSGYIPSQTIFFYLFLLTSAQSFCCFFI